MRSKLRLFLLALYVSLAAASGPGLVLGLGSGLGISVAVAQPINTAAPQAVVYDYELWNVLFEKNADTRMAPSSMTKILTAYLIFEDLANGSLELSQRFRVSSNAYQREGSTMWLGLDTYPTVDQLLNGLVVQSGNDAAVVLAEGISGSVAAFAARMNATAERLGMHNSNFVNPSGLPDENHYSTARDIALLSAAIIRDFPDYYAIFSRRSYTYNGLTQNNRNLLLGREGVDGIKTGRTQAGGFGLALSASDAERRIIVVVNGLSGVEEREREGRRLLDWGLTTFSNHALFSANQVLGYADVWLGERAQVPLVLEHPFRLTLRRGLADTLEARVVYLSPIEAPIVQGQEIGQLLLTSNRSELNERVPLVAGHDVPRLSPMSAILESLRYRVVNRY